MLCPQRAYPSSSVARLGADPRILEDGLENQGPEQAWPRTYTV